MLLVTMGVEGSMIPASTGLFHRPLLLGISWALFLSSFSLAQV